MKDLKKLVNEKGILAIAALDHRGSLKKILATEDRDEIIEFKRQAVKSLGLQASAVLLDPEYGLEVLAEKPEEVGLLLALEESGYGESETKLRENWGVKEIKKYGAAAKLLLYCSPENWQEELVAQVAEECNKEGVVFLLEPILVQATSDKQQVTREMVEKFTKYVDVLKLEYPGDEEGCKQITEVATVPWVLLSRGMEFGKYKGVLEVACKNGASGFAAGRAIWQEIGDIKDREARQKFLETTAIERFKELVEVANQWGRAI